MSEREKNRTHVFMIDVADEIYARGFRVLELNMKLEGVVFDIGA